MPDVGPATTWLTDLDDSLDATAVAEVLWLAAQHRSRPDGKEAVEPMPLDAANGAARAAGDETPVDALNGQLESEPVTAGHDVVVGEADPTGSRFGQPVSSAAVSGRISRPLVESMRALKTTWRNGRGPQLDLDWTVEQYAITRILVPVMKPVPERWFEVDLVVDRAGAGPVWDHEVDGFSRLLRDLGAFRTIRRWTMAYDHGAPYLVDRAGRRQTTEQLRAADQRRLIFVVSDFTGDAWFGRPPWDAIRQWAGSTATVLVELLPAKLRHITAVDAPTTIAQPGLPGAPNSQLTVSRHPGERPAQELPVPLLALAPGSLRRWADMLMRGDPAGCPAILLPAGRPPFTDDVLEQRQAVETLDGIRLIELFDLVASRNARRIATLSASVGAVNVDVLRFIARRLVPTATADDVAEVVVSNLFQRSPASGDVLTFRPGVREGLQRRLMKPDVWHVLDALEKYVEEHPVEHEYFSDRAAVLPFIEASDGVRELLGLDNDHAGGNTEAREPESPSLGVEDEYDEYDLPDPTEQQFEDAVSSACQDLRYREIDHDDRDFAVVGSWCNGGATIANVEPDLGTVSWSAIPDPLDGTELGFVEVDAALTFDGYVTKNTAYDLGVTIVNPDADEQYAEVAFTTDQTWTLRWEYRKDPGDSLTLDYVGVVERELNPHSLAGPKEPRPLPADPQRRLEQSLLVEDPDGERCGRAIRRAFDRLYDGPRTGHYTYDQLSSPRKLRLRSMVASAIAREFGFQHTGDRRFRWHGSDFVISFSVREHGWLIPWSEQSQLHLLITADDTRAMMRVGVIHIRQDLLGVPNKDRRSTLTAESRQQIRWLYREAVLPLNLLATMPEADTSAIMSHRSSSRRLTELFRRAPNRPVSDTVVATLVRQANPHRRIREARHLLRAEGILLLGAPHDSPVLQALHLQLPDRWWMSITAGRPEIDRVVAQRLDELGRFADADPWWSRIRVSLSTSADSDIAYVRSRRLRGEMDIAHDLVQQLIAGLADTDDRQQAARLELAVIQLCTNRRSEARSTAQAVLDYYARLGFPEHANSVAAREVLAQAWLSEHLFELSPDAALWENVAHDLAGTREKSRRSHGSLDARTLTIDVEYGFALLCLGRSEDAQAHLGRTLQALTRRYPAGHPTIMRATFLSAQADSQLHDYDRAVSSYQRAYDGLRRTLGPKHPETLATQYGRGVALVLTGRRAEGMRLIRRVAKAAPAVVGVRTDLFGQSLIAAVLLPLLPSSVLRTLGQTEPNDDADDVDDLTAQFLETFADPVHHLPWDEGDYVWIVDQWSTEDAVDYLFSDLIQAVRERLVDGLDNLSFQWLKISDIDDIDD
ncbi:NaeI family type II restriction endonuclease [Actinoplanes sp. N902-109]|uniref:NaeI family type II restriction endonuclease n=1 Tax=Actinoplanes sp. (strain N902-109) TaxID=649831 RepID=UPI0003296896|nr:NaeI family type II restriction endonuclease [Actinoplanes sp. N902-109]AGL16103.1 hypothetical protein L083_2593 [Actinoplanes sp. N902-109]